MRKKNKYNVGTSKKSKDERTVDGHVFMSKKEAERYKILKEKIVKGEIKGLEIQPEFILQIGFIDFNGKKHRPIKYIADFKYYDNKTHKTIVEDVKGWRTEVYKIKKKLFLYSYSQYIFLET